MSRSSIRAAAGPRRYLVWSDIPNDRTLRWDETDGSVSVFRQPALYSNGHTVDHEGRLVSCEHRSRCVSRTEFDGSRTVLADRHDGKRFNSPNDVVVKSDGSVWFSDPSYGIDTDYEGDAAKSEIDACNVYRIDPADGRVTVVARDFVQPNGLAFSPDESLLYIVDSGLTLLHVYNIFSARGARSLRVATLLEKPGNSKYDRPLDYVGFKIPSMCRFRPPPFWATFPEPDRTVSAAEK